MFLRISGSSSITNIFFMIPSKNRQTDGYGCAFPDAAVQLHLPSVQIRAAFHQQQAQPSPRTRPDIAPAMKCLEQLLLILPGDANSAVTNDAHGIGSVPVNPEVHGRARL